MKFQYRVMLFALIVILVTAYAAPTSTPSPTTDWQTFTNPEGDFSIQYPST